MIEWTISTSGSTGTGLKKCSPITLCGCDVSAPSFMIGTEDVFEARKAASGSSSSSRLNRSRLRRSSSTIASIAASAPSTSSSDAVKARRSRAASRSSSAELAGAHAAVERLRDRRARLLDPAGVDLDHRDVDARARAHLRDPRAHEAATDDSDSHGRARYRFADRDPRPAAVERVHREPAEAGARTPGPGGSARPGLHRHDADGVRQLRRPGEDHPAGAALGGGLPGDVSRLLAIVDVLRDRGLRSRAYRCRSRRTWVHLDPASADESCELVTLSSRSLRLMAQTEQFAEARAFEESPDTTGQRWSVTPTRGNPRESATENTPPTSAAASAAGRQG